MTYNNIDDAIIYISKEIELKRAKEIKFSSNLANMSNVNFIDVIIAYNPRLMFTISKIKTLMSNCFLGNYNFILRIEYTDVFSSCVDKVENVAELQKLIIKTVSMHQRNTYFVFENILKNEIDRYLEGITNIPQVLNNYIYNYEKYTFIRSGYIGINIKFQYSCGHNESIRRKKEIEKKLEFISKYAKKDGIEDYKKAFNVVKYCVTNWTYGDYGDMKIGYTDYGAIVNKKAVCMGISLAICKIFNHLGIPCRYVVGAREGVGHAWNLVYIRGGWFYIDVTDAICLNNPYYHWGVVQFDDRIITHTFNEKLKCNCNEMFIRKNLN